MGKFDVAPLPGITGPGVSSLGGHNYAIAKNAENKGTAVDFLKFMSSEEVQKNNTLATSNSPTLEKLYYRPGSGQEVPRSCRSSSRRSRAPQPRPKAVEYGDVTLAIQDAAYSALQGQTAPDAALQSLQTKLQTLIK